MEPFDKKRCLDNIYFLAKQKGKKIGELEELASVSTGYLYMDDQPNDVNDTDDGGLPF